MFGYVIPPTQELSEIEKKQFQSAYCGLCHRLGELYGFRSKLFLNYDLTFLLLLLMDSDNSMNCRRCALHPIKKRQVNSSAAVDITCHISVILVYCKFQDDTKDSTGFRKLIYRILLSFIKRPYVKASKALEDFDNNTREQLKMLCSLEEANCNSIDRVADCFANILSFSAKYCSGCITKERITKELLYHLGRWIYILDAYDDLLEDMKHHNYNPLICKYKLRNASDAALIRVATKNTLNASLASIATAFELYTFCSDSLIHKMIYIGLPSIQHEICKHAEKNNLRMEHNLE